MKLNLGVGPFPIHQQHLDIMGDISEWTLVDKFVHDDRIKNWDAEVLDEVKNETVDVIYASHLLEHISHRNLVPVLETWYAKLKPGGKLIINVPDMEWAAHQILRFESGQILSGLYSDYEGEHGLQSVIFGSHAHEGEYHKACFVRTSLWELLDGVGYKKIKIDQFEDAHEMGILFATCIKPENG